MNRQIKDLAPICLFVYNRPEHTENTLKALSNNILAKESVLHIFSDGAKTKSAEEKVKSVRQVVLQFSKLNAFKKVYLHFSDHNKGLAKSIIGGVSEVIGFSKKVIVLEDDLITRKDFLSFMNDCLCFYKHNSSIWSISGHSFPLKSLEDYKSDIYILRRACSWGWATWEDRWNLVDWDVSDYGSFRRNLSKRHRFSCCGNDMPRMLDSQMNGAIDSWAVRWCYSSFLNNKWTIYPKETRIINNGCDGSGTHRVNNSNYLVDFKKPGCYFLENVSQNKFVTKEFLKICSIRLYLRIVSFIKYNILISKPKKT